MCASMNELSTLLFLILHPHFEPSLISIGSHSVEGLKSLSLNTVIFPHPQILPKPMDMSISILLDSAQLLILLTSLTDSPSSFGFHSYYFPSVVVALQYPLQVPFSLVLVFLKTHPMSASLHFLWEVTSRFMAFVEISMPMTSKSLLLLTPDSTAF